MTVTASPEYTPQPPALEQPAAPQPPKKRPVGLIVTLAAAGVVVLLAAAVAITATVVGNHKPPATAVSAANAHSAAPAAMLVTGTLLLTYSTGVENLDDITCQGMGPYDDIHPGSQIVITDQSGTVVATTSLDTGKLIGSGPTRQCQFRFTASGVPKGHPFYGVQLGRRGSIQYSETQLESGPQLKLGP